MIRYFRAFSTYGDFLNRGYSYNYKATLLIMLGEIESPVIPAEKLLSPSLVVWGFRLSYKVQVPQQDLGMLTILS